MESKPWLPYVAPFAIYVLFLSAQTPQNLLWVYPVKTVAVALALWAFRKKYEELCSPMWCSGASAKHRDDAPGEGTCASQKRSYNSAATTWLLAVAVGLIAITIWIAIDRFYPKLSESQPFDPTGKWVFIGFRVVGAVVVVPLMEELFWRAFLIRWLVNPDFKRVAVGTFTWLSFAVTTVLFGLEHNEWLAGLICGALYNWLYYKRRSVLACVVAHAVSNAALAAWVLTRGDWKLW